MRQWDKPSEDYVRAAAAAPVHTAAVHAGGRLVAVGGKEQDLQVCVHTMSISLAIMRRMSCCCENCFSLVGVLRTLLFKAFLFGAKD